MSTYRFDGGELRRRRIQAGFTLGGLAAAVGRSVPSLVKYQADLLPSTAVLLRLSDVLGCEPGALFSPVEDREEIMT